ncbi:MAG TPA: hypothetical protein VI358_18185 [Pseudolabrys sp.]
MALSHAYKNGLSAFEDGIRLHENPFHPFEEKVQWSEWRDGWQDAGADAEDNRKTAVEFYPTIHTDY